jgi:hypothetical protein
MVLSISSTVATPSDKTSQASLICETRILTTIKPALSKEYVGYFPRILAIS